MNINAILAKHQRNCSRGAPLGDVNIVPGDGYMPDRMRCQRVQMVDDCYGADGTYWGMPTERSGHVYCAFNEGVGDDHFAAAQGVRIYVRAHTYEGAVRQVLAMYPDLKFARSIPKQTNTP